MTGHADLAHEAAVGIRWFFECHLANLEEDELSRALDWVLDAREILNSSCRLTVMMADALLYGYEDEDGATNPE